MSEDKPPVANRYPVVVVSGIALGMTFFQLYTSGIRLLSTDLQGGIHLGFALLLIYLTYPASPKAATRPAWRWADAFLALLSVWVSAYRTTQVEALLFRVGNPSPQDVIWGTLTILLVLEAARRVVGWSLVITSLAALVYALTGPLLPGMLRHPGMDWGWVASHLYTSTEGIYGIAIQVSSTFIFVFIVFAAVLKEAGGGDAFVNLSSATVGRFRGGPAKVAVVASACFGTISGSAAANVVGTGSFTIPLMRRLGYKPEFAGAVEAVASSGGMLMPPVMGAAAFIMVEYVRIPYAQIALHAVLPAILYYTALLLMVDMEASKLGLRGISSREVPAIGPIVRGSLPLLLSVLVLIYFLFQMRATPGKAAFWAIAVTLALYILQSLFQRKPAHVKAIPAVLAAGARESLPVVAACAAAGIVIGVLTLTGIALKFTFILATLSGGYLFPLLLLTMLASIVLGMGLPTVAVYVIMATLMAPALVDAGIPVLAAHFFVFYFGILANVTPPVAIAAYVAAGLAGADLWRTGLLAFKLALAGFLLPFMFVYGPEVLGIGPLGNIFLAAVTGFVGVLALAGAVQGYLLGRHQSWLCRLLLFGAALTLMKPGWVTDVIGVGLLAVALVLSRALPGRPKPSLAHGRTNADDQ